ncbi:MAG TPA: hypothetical protein VEQ58_10535 [Polyangiaceae bacterium]|nr:hypothetical protein [Polyangiaceae bacterium]
MAAGFAGALLLGALLLAGTALARAWLGSAWGLAFAAAWGLAFAADWGLAFVAERASGGFDLTAGFFLALVERGLGRDLVTEVLLTIGDFAIVWRPQPAQAAARSIGRYHRFEQKNSGPKSSSRFRVSRAMVVQ